jgi:hypothetical protein
MEVGATRARAGNLTAALVVVAFLELLVNRLAGRLFLPGSTISGERVGSAAARLVGDSGPLLFHLTGVLAFGILIAACIGLLRRGELFPRPTRITVVVIALAFWSLGVVAILVGEMQSQLFMYLATSFAFLSLLIGASFLGSRARPRVKVGVVWFTLPGALHVISVFAERKGWLASGSALDVTRLGEIVLLAANLAAPFLLVPRAPAERSWGLPLGAAALLSAAFAVVLGERYDLAQASALYGLRLEIPRLGTPLGVAYVLALGGWACATAQLLAQKGGARLAGYGLLLVAIGGYQAASPVELGLSLVGLLALSVGELRASPPRTAGASRVGHTEWRRYVDRLAAALNDSSEPPEMVVAEEGDMEVSRIRVERHGQPVSIRLLRRRSALVEIDATVGRPTHGSPDASIERHRRWLARSPADRVRLPRARTGDAAFDREFSVHGQAPLADEELRRRVARGQGDGIISVWAGAAARYLLSSPGREHTPPAFLGKVDDDGAVTSLVDVVDTLSDLIQASAPASA